MSWQEIDLFSRAGVPLSYRGTRRHDPANVGGEMMWDVGTDDVVSGMRRPIPATLPSAGGSAGLTSSVCWDARFAHATVGEVPGDRG